MEKIERKPLYDHKAEGFIDAAGFDANGISQADFAKTMAKTLHSKLKKSACPSEFAEDVIYSAFEGDKACKYFILEAVTNLILTIGRN